jgi:hypothetical protein
MKERQYVARFGDAQMAVIAKNARPLDKMNEEKLQLAGKHSGLVKRVGELMHAGRLREGMQAIGSTPGALENPFIKLTYASISENLGYNLLTHGKPEEGLAELATAMGLAEACRDQFDKQRWNYEADTVRFNVRKHMGDCHFDMMQAAAEAEDAKGAIKRMDEVGRYYSLAVELWNERMDSVKVVFQNTVMINYLNLGNMFINWAVVEAASINVATAALGIVDQSDKARRAVQLIEQGIAMRELSKKLLDKSRWHIPGYHQAYASKEGQAQALYAKISALAVVCRAGDALGEFLH